MGYLKENLQRKQADMRSDLHGRNPLQKKPAVSVLQKAAPEEELQKKAMPFQMAKPEEELQMKQAPLQMANPEEELQKKDAPFQMAAPEEELQKKEAPFQMAQPEEELQMKAASAMQFAKPEEELQMKEAMQLKANNTGMPDNLKSGIENLSGMDMSDVKVHYNSSQPAQLNALAYAQGNNIHIGPGQEQHLPHEAWHVVQQRQGRVQATKQMKGGVAVNDDPGLEHEADVMGAKALQAKPMNPNNLNKSHSSNSFFFERKVAGAPENKENGNEWVVLNNLSFGKGLVGGDGGGFGAGRRQSNLGGS